MAVKETFKSKKLLETALLTKEKNISAFKHNESGERLNLYYVGNTHIGTWNSSEKIGWSFI